MTSNSAAGSVPVFNCVVHVGREADGAVVARVANLPGISVRGQTEREALASVVAAFKAEVARCHGARETIPLIDNYGRPQPGQSERLIAVHL
jgi:predicted RNase H-like HicB family nuclease